ncbi:hypothetical protein MTR67_050831, partial [Solanum verrucosum]
FLYSNNPNSKGHNSLIQTRNSANLAYLEISFQELSCNIRQFKMNMKKLEIGSSHFWKKIQDLEIRPSVEISEFLANFE